MSETQVRDHLASIRAAWSEEERERRIKLAETKQLELGQLIVLSDMLRKAAESEAVASAC